MVAVAYRSHGIGIWSHRFRIDLHPINYRFLAAALFAFHLLFAYTVLTVSYLRLVAGLRFAAVEAALAQFFYLILFSLALFDEGYSGLSITTGAIVTLFIAMQVTGRIDRSERFAAKPNAPASGGVAASAT
jgi:hypothetical protein